MKTLADPSFQGRHVGTPGEQKGAQFVADAFRAAGLRPGGDNGSYLQAFPLEVEELAAPPMLQLTANDGTSRQLALRDDFRPVVAETAGGGDVQGQAVFAGSGSDLAGFDVTGEVVMVTPREPLLTVINRLRAAGAAGVIVTTGQTALLKAEARPPQQQALPVVEVTQSGAAALFEGSGHTREELNATSQAGQPLPTFPLTWHIHLAVSLTPPHTVEGHNVIGVLPAADGSTTRSVVVGGHYEEIGPDPDGVVFPAANDNASGTAVVVELARLFHDAGIRPPANIVLVAWSGHEEGLFGSRFYVDHPTFPLPDIALYLNVDTVGQGASSMLEAIASNAAATGTLTQAVDLFKSQAGQFSVGVVERPAGGSDNETFQGKGVPTLSLEWGGIFADGRIHTPADTADTVDPGKLATAGKLAALAALIAAR